MYHPREVREEDSWISVCRQEEGDLLGSQTQGAGSSCSAPAAPWACWKEAEEEAKESWIVVVDYY